MRRRVNRNHREDAARQVEERQSIKRYSSNGPHLYVVVIYCHLSKLSVGQTPRLCSLPSKSYSNNINVPFTRGNNLVKESGEPFNGMPINF